MHSIPLLQYEDLTEENWGNIQATKKKKNQYI